MQQMKMLCVLASVALAACQNQAPSTSVIIDDNCKTALVVLGTAQDAGKPQISVHGDAAWTDPSKAALAVYSTPRPI